MKKKYGKSADHTYVFNTLTNFQYEAHQTIGNGNVEGRFVANKVRTFRETNKSGKNLPHGCDKSADLLSKLQNHGDDFSNYVCFPKSPNLNELK